MKTSITILRDFPSPEVIREMRPEISFDSTRENLVGPNINLAIIELRTVLWMMTLALATFRVSVCVLFWSTRNLFELLWSCMVFLVRGVICLVNSENERDLNISCALLINNHIKKQCLIFISRQSLRSFYYWLIAVTRY